MAADLQPCATFKQQMTMHRLATANNTREANTLEKRFIAEKNSIIPHGYNTVDGSPARAFAIRAEQHRRQARKE
jgi:hypothetical protein